MNTVTVEQIKSRIKDVVYTNVPGTTTTVCSLVIDNGFVVTGTSACVDKRNFNKEIGEEIAYDDAFDKLWTLEGYLLKEKLYQAEMTACETCSKSEEDAEGESAVEVHVMTLSDLSKLLFGGERKH